MESVKAHSLLDLVGNTPLVELKPEGDTVILLPAMAGGAR